MSSEDVIDTDDSYDVSDESDGNTFTENTESGSAESKPEPKPKPVRTKSNRQLKLSQTAKCLVKKNYEIATTFKSITENNLTPIKIKEEVNDGTPSWVRRAMEAREKRIQKELKNPKEPENKGSPEPEWIKKAKEAQISRDIRGLDRFVNKNAPELPPEPEWFSRACKRRDLSTLLATPEKVHVSNVETPNWVHSSPAQKILNAFLHDDEGIRPDWMNKGIQMSNNEKTILLEQLEKLKELLEEERKTTIEQETFLASSKDMLQKAQIKLEESVTSYRFLRENRKGENVQNFIDSSNEIFSKNSKFMNEIKEEFEVNDIVDEFVEEEKKKYEIKREIYRENARKQRKKKPRKKSTSKTKLTSEEKPAKKKRHREKNKI